MKRNKLHSTIFSAALILLAGCASTHYVGKSVAVTPSPYVLTPDSSSCIEVDMGFHIPNNYFSKRSRLIILPVFMDGESVKAEFTPLVVDAPIYDKKLKRRKVLNNYVDSHENSAIKVDQTLKALSIPYKTTMQLPAGTDQGRVVAIITTDGCGECTGIDTIDVAAISQPASLIDNRIKESLQLSWIEPKFIIRPKIVEGRGIARLQFGINQSTINLSLGNNEAELHGMLSKLSPILTDSLATLDIITITGVASADGSLAFNTNLAQNRATAARKWMVEQLDVSPSIRKRISANSRPEGWMPILTAMVNDNHSDSLAVKVILEKYRDENDDVQERHIRRLACWSDIKTKYLQKDRKVEYVYSYTLKSFTSDNELRAMYKKRPDAFNEDELLRVATLTESHDGKKEVYLTIMNYFPQSAIAANNLAVLYLREGKDDDARAVLARQKEYSPEMINTLAVSYVYAEDYEKAIELLQNVDMPQAHYNLGLLKAKRRELNEAYELLRPFADVNSAVIALSVNKNQEAERILAHVSDKTPIAEYARSMAAARLEKHTIFYKHIGNACRDKKLRRRAASEADFYRYQTEAAFQTLINQ